MNISKFFDQNGICKHHDDPEYKIVQFKLNERGDIHLIYANITFFKEFCLSEHTLNKNVWEIFEFEVAYAFSERCQFIKHNKEHLHFINSISFPNGVNSKSVWQHSLSYENNVLTCIGVKQQTKSTSSLRVENNIYRYYNTTHSDFLMFKMKKTKTGYKYTTDDPLLLKKMGRETLVGESIDPKRGISTAALLYSLLDSCLGSNKIIEFVDTVRFDDGIAYIEVKLIPSNFEKDEIIFFGTFLTKEEYEKHQVQNGFIDTNYPANFTYGSCLINMEDRMFIEISNKYIYSFLDEHALKIEDLINMAEYTAAIELGKNITNQYSFPKTSEDNEKSNVSISFIPTFSDDGKCVKMLIIICAREDEESITKVLTKREMEIANYIVLGRTNRYIAFELNITEGTVKRTAHNIYQKLGISSRVELINHMYNS